MSAPAAAIALSLVAPLAGVDADPSTTTYSWGVPPAMQARLVEEGRKGYVELVFRFAPYDPAAAVDQNHWWKIRGGYGADDIWQNRQSVRIPAARASDGRFAAPIGEYDVEHLADISAADADGKLHPAKPYGVSRRGALVWFRAGGLADSALPARAPFLRPDRGYSARLTTRIPDSRITVNTWSPPRPKSWGPYFRAGEKPGAPASPASRYSDPDYEMIFDSSGSWRAWSISRSWGDGETLVDPEAEARDVLPWDDLLKARAGAERAALDRLAVARLRFRPDVPDPNAMFSFSVDSGSEDRDKQLKSRADAAYPIGGGRLFVPVRLSPALVQRLEAVEVLRGGKAGPARLIGVLKGRYEGYLLASDDAGPALGGGTTPEDDELTLAVEPHMTGERLRLRSYADRLDGWTPSYKDQLRRRAHLADDVGSLLCSLDGRPYALIVEEARYENLVDRSGWRSPTPLAAPIPLEVLARDLSGPEDSLVDSAVRPRTVLENKRRPWIGVETQDLTADLARLLGVSAATQDGASGQLVNSVLPGSPAAKAGLKPGDVILRLREAGKTDEIVVTPKKRYGGIGSGSLIDWLRRPQTGLDAALARFHEGSKIAVIWARGADEKSGEAVLRESPLDVESAPKLVDKELGLTVKEVTDDARRLLKLKPDFQGLLVYDVDSGSPASIAGFAPTSLLTEAAGKPLSSLADLTNAVAAERAAKKPTIRLRASFFGRSRYAELRLPPEAK